MAVGCNKHCIVPIIMSARTLKALEKRVSGLTLMPSLAMLNPRDSVHTGTDPDKADFVEVVNLDDSDDDVPAAQPPPAPPAAPCANSD